MSKLPWAFLLLAVGCSPVPVRPMAGDGGGETETTEPPRSDDPIEDLRRLQCAAAGGDGRCALLWLGRVGEPRATLSQRMLARTMVEDLLARGPLRDPSGRDVTAQVRDQLALSWKFHEPVSPERARRIAAGEPRRAFDEAPMADGFWLEERGTVWAGGHDRLFLTTGLLAFLTGPGGEPVFRGTHLSLRNLGLRTVYVSCDAAAEYNRPLRPGESLVASVDLRVVGTGTYTTGVDVSVRAWRERDVLVRSMEREP